jgi:hypothetical protein
MAIDGNTIYCDCCGTQKLAEIVGENLVIKDRRHGEKHLAVVPIKSLLAVMVDQATLDKLADLGIIITTKREPALEPAKV